MKEEKRDLFTIIKQIWDGFRIGKKDLQVNWKKLEAAEQELKK